MAAPGRMTAVPDMSEAGEQARALPWWSWFEAYWQRASPIGVCAAPYGTSDTGSTRDEIVLLSLLTADFSKAGPPGSSGSASARPPGAPLPALMKRLRVEARLQAGVETTARNGG